MIKYRLSTNHFLTWSPQGLLDSRKYRRLDPKAWGFLSALEDDLASHAITATANKQLVGWLRCSVGPPFEEGELFAQGTWVEESYRGLHVASILWDKALNAFKPTLVHVTTVSEGGKALIQRVHRRYPEIDFVPMFWR